jgi:hypothetical protein
MLQTRQIRALRKSDRQNIENSEEVELCRFLRNALHVFTAELRRTEQRKNGYPAERSTENKVVITMK